MSSSDSSRGFTPKKSNPQLIGGKMSDKKETTATMAIMIGEFPCGHWKMKVDITWENGTFTEVPVEHCFDTKEQAEQQSEAIAKEIVTSLVAKGFPFNAKFGHQHMLIRNPHAPAGPIPHPSNPTVH
jgi:hypothetical protein